MEGPKKPSVVSGITLSELSSEVILTNIKRNPYWWVILDRRPITKAINLSKHLSFFVFYFGERVSKSASSRLRHSDLKFAVPNLDQPESHIYYFTTGFLDPIFTTSQFVDASCWGFSHRGSQDWSFSKISANLSVFEFRIQPWTLMLLDSRAKRPRLVCIDEYKILFRWET